jgi:hypothetical protein
VPFPGGGSDRLRDVLPRHTSELVNVVGAAEPPAQVALRLYSKDQLIADPWLLDVYDLERRIMFDNTRNNKQWLVQSRGMFGDLWNRYLIMVSFTPCGTPGLGM